MLVLNDIHIGTSRKAGTTPASQEALRTFVFSAFSSLLASDQNQDNHTIINGDLFDRFEVEAADLIRTYSILSKHIEDGNKLTLVMGNHDFNPRGGKVSSFHMLAHFLVDRFPTSVQVVDHNVGLTQIDGSVWAIPHMPNQDMFDLELESAAELSGGTLLLHANYANNFADEADHSLNVSEEQADRLIQSGWTLLFGHEHQSKLAKEGRVVIPGNQIPTSVADCLGCRAKYQAILEDGKVRLDLLYDIGTMFVDVPWTELVAMPHESIRFIRVSGTATAEQGADVVSEVARLRQNHPALVITNAVKVEGLAEFDQLAQMSFDQITAFNVLEALLEELSPEEGVAVKELLNA